ncbi:MAG: transporter [Pseudomonadota bacterium]
MRHRSVLPSLVLLMGNLPGAFAAAGPSALSSDRPDAPDGSGTVGSGHIQLELGVDQSTALGEPNSTALRVPFKLRLGVSEVVELHLESDGPAVDLEPVQDAGVQLHAGISDLGLGLKWNFAQPGSDAAMWQPSMGVLVSLVAPFGTERFSASQLLLKTALIADFSLPLDLSLGTNLVLVGAIDGRPSQSALWRATASLWRPLTPWTTDLRLFVDSFVQGALTLEGSPLLSFGAGAAYSIHPDFQVDLYLRSLVDDGGGSLGGGLGIALRL